MGILTIAIGGQNYGKMAVALYYSIRHKSEAPVSIIYSKSAFKGLEEYLSLFDKKIEVDDSVNPSAQAMKLKMELDLHTPYARTLFLDADTVVCPMHSIDTVLNQLDGVPFAAYNTGFSKLGGTPPKKYVNWADYKDILASFPELTEDTVIPQINSSFLYWEGDGAKLFSVARQVSEVKIKTAKWRGQYPDELALNIACAKTGIYPHKKNYRPAYLYIINAPVSKEHLIENYPLLSVLGTKENDKVIGYYNDFVAHYMTMAGCKEVFRYQSKKTLNYNKITLYYHVYMKNHWRDIVTEQIEILKKSGLYHKCERVVVGCIGAQEDTKSLMKILGSSKYEVHYWGEEGFEQPTLRLLADKTKDGIVCYFHTKGASKLADNVKEWRDEMNENVLLRWRDCVAYLKQGYDTAGVNWCENNGGLKNYYEGNFWWSTSDYIKGLQPIKESSRYDAEFWIGSGSPKAKNIEGTTNYK